MTREETKQIIRVIADTYPNWKPNNISSVVDTWYWQLQNDDYKLISTALMAYNRNNTTGFAPSIGQLIDIANNTILANDAINMTDSEVFSLVRKAMRNSAYHAKEEYDKLPQLAQKAVGSADNLRRWATEENLNITVVESNFRKTYNNLVQRYKTERTLLPMMGVIDKLRISNGTSPIALETLSKRDNLALTVDGQSR